MIKYIKLEDCKIGRLYKLQSRNLSIGVYDGLSGFIGIRFKFESEYLFTEYHWDTGEPFGTAYPIKDLGPIPKDIKPVEDFGIIDDSYQKNRMLFDYLKNYSALKTL